MEKLIYLDNAATTFPKPQEVYDFMHEFYQKHGVNPGRSGYDMTLETEEIVQNTRKMLTEFFNGTDPNRLTFSYNASDSLNMIIDGMVAKGDHVITSNLEHNSVLRPLYHKQLDGIIDITYIPFDEKGYIDPDDVKTAIKKNTKMVIINHGSNVIGTVQPVAEIGRICREADVSFAVDASQTAGAQKIDVQAMNIDLLAFTGHKSLMGPTGIGGSYVQEHVSIRSSRYGGTGVRSAQKTHLEEFPYRLECGTLNIMGVAGLNAGQKWIAKYGVENIHQQELKLWDKLKKGLEAIDRVITYCAESTENRNPVLSFNIQGWEAGDVGTMLDVDYSIACRTGLQCAPLVHEQLGTDKIHGTVRLSLGAFNTEEHIDKVIEAVKEIAAIKR
ncbi:aminotransferase class V-fold PLP-dependent enzyme [candidate division KSB1 bacterium]|nr:aminotransferase class V-fold PLP-dependent enzyme [candidate division KSB1 bacterium]